MTLSTAIPASVRALPDVLTWKIGEKERFIPTPWRADRPPPPPAPPPMPPPIPMPRSEADELRQQLVARAQSSRPQMQAQAEPVDDLEEAEAKAPAGNLAMAAPPSAAAAPPLPPPVQYKQA